MTLLGVIAGLGGIAGLFWGAETFAKHLAVASNRLGVSGFALAIESVQTVIGTTLLGFATGFELVVLMWSAARHGVMEAAISGVVGSFSYNMMMTIGAAALVRPMLLTEASELHMPLLFMMGSLELVIFLSLRNRELGRSAGVVLVAVYGFFIAYEALHTHL